MRYWDGQQWTDQTAPGGGQPGPDAGQAGPGGGPAGPSGAYPAPPPPAKKQNWFVRHKILTALLAIVLIAIIAGVASGGGGDENETASDEPTSEATESTEPTEEAEPTDEAEPTEETEPAEVEGSLPLEDGDWRLDSVQLKDDGLGDFGGTARITYTGEDNDASNLFTITVLAKDGTVVASLDGAAEGMGPDGTETVQLISTDPWKPGNYTLFDFQTLM